MPRILFLVVAIVQSIAFDAWAKSVDGTMFFGLGYDHPKTVGLHASGCQWSTGFFGFGSTADDINACLRMDIQFQRLVLDPPALGNFQEVPLALHVGAMPIGYERFGLGGSASFEVVDFRFAHADGTFTTHQGTPWVGLATLFVARLHEHATVLAQYHWQWMTPGNRQQLGVDININFFRVGESWRNNRLGMLIRGARITGFYNGEKVPTGWHLTLGLGMAI